MLFCARVKRWKEQFHISLTPILLPEVKAEGLSGLSQWNDTEWWINVGQSHWGEMWTESAAAAPVLLLLHHLYLFILLWRMSLDCCFFFLYSVCLSFYLCLPFINLLSDSDSFSGLSECCVGIPLALCALNIMLFSDLKKNQQTLIPRQETLLQHTATSQSPAVKMDQQEFVSVAVNFILFYFRGFLFETERI